MNLFENLAELGDSYIVSNINILKIIFMNFLYFVINKIYN